LTIDRFSSREKITEISAADYHNQQLLFLVLQYLQVRLKSVFVGPISVSSWGKVSNIPLSKKSCKKPIFEKTRCGLRLLLSLSFLLSLVLIL